MGNSETQENMQQTMKNINFVVYIVKEKLKKIFTKATPSASRDRMGEARLAECFLTSIHKVTVGKAYFPSLLGTGGGFGSFFFGLGFRGRGRETSIADSLLAAGGFSAGEVGSGTVKSALDAPTLCEPSIRAGSSGISGFAQAIPKLPRTSLLQQLHECRYTKKTHHSK